MLKSAIIGTVLLASTMGVAQAQTAWVVRPEWVSAHESFLASDALNGRGSATRDEAIAASYVASQFQSYGLAPAPGLNSYLQTATIIRPRLDGAPSLSFLGVKITSSMKLLTSSGESVKGAVKLVTSDDPKAMPRADIVMVSAAPSRAWFGAAQQKQVKLLIFRDGEAAQNLWVMMGSHTSMGAYLEGEKPSHSRGNMVILSADVFDKLAAKPDTEISFDLPAIIEDKSLTTNAIGYLKGSDPKAGTILYSAHLDHLGAKPDGVIMHGANDDASGTTAVLEIAHALTAGQTPKRSILFIAYGSEEIGEFGSLYFGKHSPVPLESIIANIEFEMIGAQDPKLPTNSLMMTGFSKSDLGEALKRHGALVVDDPYPDQHFFERSDNYQLALKGIVAHTVSGWATTPTYHQASDDLAHLNLPFMTAAIQSLIIPATWLANSDFVPQWKPGSKP